MSTLPAIILELILTRLAALFLTGAGGDIAAARQAASQMLATFHPQTTEELRLAANIISFSFHALDALAQAATPDMPLTRILRLRGSAVSLSRESAKAECRLAQLRKASQQPAPQPETHPEPEPKIDRAADLIQKTGKVAAFAKANNLTWTQAYQHRQREARIAARLQKTEVRTAALANKANVQAKQRPDSTSRVDAATDQRPSKTALSG